MPPKVHKPPEELGEILSAEELADFRAWNEIRKRKDPEFKRQEALLDEQPDLHEMVAGKKATQWLYAASGSLAKWVVAIAAVITAWKTNFFGLGAGPGAGGHP